MNEGPPPFRGSWFPDSLAGSANSGAAPLPSGVDEVYLGSMKDALVEAVRKARQEQAAKWNFDLKAILADARRRQEQSGRQVVSFAPKRDKAG